jgi:hypothetical protein
MECTMRSLEAALPFAAFDRFAFDKWFEAVLAWDQRFDF